MSRVPSIVATTLGYERWLGERVAALEADLAHKHALMTQSLSSFLRGTYYHWALLWPQVCAKLSRAPRLLAVGDVHLANFGTWRDSEGRLVWGVNDLDETARMPYAADLVRLATSALIESRTGTLAAGACRGSVTRQPNARPHELAEGPFRRFISPLLTTILAQGLGQMWV